MDHRRRHNPDDDREASSRHAPSRQPPRASGPAGTSSILDLQAMAGNRAMTDLLAPRATDPAGPVTVQREPEQPAPADDRGAGRAPTLQIPELKVDVPLQSFQLQLAGAGRGQGRGEKKDTGGEAVVTMASSHVGAGLYKAIREGQKLAVVTVVMGRTTFTLRDVFITGLSQSDEYAQLTLVFYSKEDKTQQVDPKDGPKEAPPAYDLTPGKGA